MQFQKQDVRATADTACTSKYCMDANNAVCILCLGTVFGNKGVADEEGKYRIKKNVQHVWCDAVRKNEGETMTARGHHSYMHNKCMIQMVEAAIKNGGDVACPTCRRPLINNIASPIQESFGLPVGEPQKWPNTNVRVSGGCVCVMENVKIDNVRLPWSDESLVPYRNSLLEAIDVCTDLEHEMADDAYGDFYENLENLYIRQERYSPVDDQIRFGLGLAMVVALLQRRRSNDIHGVIWEAAWNDTVYSPQVQFFNNDTHAQLNFIAFFARALDSWLDLDMDNNNLRKIVAVLQDSQYAVENAQNRQLWQADESNLRISRASSITMATLPFSEAFLEFAQTRDSFLKRIDSMRFGNRTLVQDVVTLYRKDKDTHMWRVGIMINLVLKMVELKSNGDYSREIWEFLGDDVRCIASASDEIFDTTPALKKKMLKFSLNKLFLASIRRDCTWWQFAAEHVTLAKTLLQTL
jgi:hypothetical protein